MSLASFTFTFAFGNKPANTVTFNLASPLVEAWLGKLGLKAEPSIGEVLTEKLNLNYAGVEREQAYLVDYAFKAPALLELQAITGMTFDQAKKAIESVKKKRIVPISFLPLTTREGIKNLQNIVIEFCLPSKRFELEQRLKQEDAAFEKTFFSGQRQEHLSL